MATRSHGLGELQLAVLNVLWTQRQATVHEVLAALPSTRKPAYTTVLTVLRNLEKRGLVAHEMSDGSRTFRYHPLISAYDARESILQDVLNRLFAGSPALLVKHLLETEGFTLEELRQIHQVLHTQEQAVSGKSASSTSASL
jgi:BlaI family penicillinase repressor